MIKQAYPQSPKALVGGIAHLGRFIDKIRLRNAGRIQDRLGVGWALAGTRQRHPFSAGRRALPSRLEIGRCKRAL